MVDFRGLSLCIYEHNQLQQPENKRNLEVLLELTTEHFMHGYSEESLYARIFKRCPWY